MVIIPNYEAMYTTLFNAITDVIDILQKAQIKAEEIYISDESEESSQEDEEDNK